MEKKLKTPDERIKELEYALKVIMEYFPKEVLKDQLNEDYELIEKALKKTKKHETKKN
jgi:hypothetical protein